ncbi:MAG: hypothetical protein ABW172_13800 [Candidatus Binatia bacterium]
MALVYLHRIEAMKQLGAPVEWVKTTNLILVALGPIAISAKAAHLAKAVRERPEGIPYAETRLSDPDGNLIDLSVHGFLGWQPLERKPHD